MAKNRDLLPFEFPPTTEPGGWIRGFVQSFRRFVDLLRQKFIAVDQRLDELAAGGTGGGGGTAGAPANRTYVTVGGEAGALPASRRLAVTDDLRLQDEGPGGRIVIGRNSSLELVIPQLAADPSSPGQQTAWVRHSTSPGASGSMPTGLLLALAVHQADPVEVYELSYRTTEDTTRRVALA